MKTKSRFCPSPTGHMHIGNMRTALFNALAAAADKGVFLLRIEDTDPERSRDEYTQQIEHDLKSLGLGWQEGPEVDGQHGPYWQSQRQDIYDKYYEQLREMGRAYPCFCSEQKLAMTRKAQRSAGQPPRYPGTCRHLSADEIQQKLAEGQKPTLRFKIPAGETVEFTDLVRGLQRFQTDDIGDFIIRRGDGSTSFMYCNAIDDSLMEVTLAMRGEDHLTNTPRQLMILDALKLRAPEYGHISLILGSDGSPLSKRNGSRSVKEIVASGYLPLALLNYFARLGHVYENPAFMSLADLQANFKIANLSKAPARYDEQQLLYWQKEAVQQLSGDAFWQWVEPFVIDQVPSDQKTAFVEAVRANVTFPEEAAVWATVLFADALVFDEAGKAILQSADTAFFEAAIAAVQSHGTDYKLVVDTIKEKAGVKGKSLFQPLRIAVTGQVHGPELATLFDIIGQDRLLARLQQASKVEV